MRKIYFIFVCLLFAGCASKVVAPLDFEGGLTTLNNLSRGELNLACDDAAFLVKLFDSHDGVIFKYTAMKIAYPKEAQEEHTGSDMDLYNAVYGEYNNFEARILAPFTNDREAYGKVAATVVNTDIRNVFSASFIRYLGLMDKTMLDEYVQVAFCGGKRSDNFMSPADVDDKLLQEAILRKLKELKK